MKTLGYETTFHCKECGDFSVLHTAAVISNNRCGWCGRFIKKVFVKKIQAKDNAQAKHG